MLMYTYHSKGVLVFLLSTEYDGDSNENSQRLSFHMGFQKVPVVFAPCEIVVFFVRETARVGVPFVAAWLSCGSPVSCARPVAPGAWKASGSWGTGRNSSDLSAGVGVFFVGGTPRNGGLSFGFPFKTDKKGFPQKYRPTAAAWLPDTRIRSALMVATKLLNGMEGLFMYL